MSAGGIDHPKCCSCREILEDKIEVLERDKNEQVEAYEYAIDACEEQIDLVCEKIKDLQAEISKFKGV